jgi:hypothetical protein
MPGHVLWLHPKSHRQLMKTLGGTSCWFLRARQSTRFRVVYIWLLAGLSVSTDGTPGVGGTNK